jgi:GDP/UDP-N,N'-diacetylbacillosamine 2-epimerase (hydrolysing)
MGDAGLRHVLYISGSRADYGAARRLLQTINSDPDLNLSILVTGMHLDPVHGETWQEIAADGLNIVEKIYGRITGDSLATMAASIGLYLYGISQTVSRLKPDIVLVLGDRGEQLAGTIAAAIQNIVVVHLCGGSLSGSIDDSIRHAITKFAHYHLPAFEEHAQRIIQMGEDPRTVCVVGLPGGDIRPDVKFSREEICAEFGLPTDQPYLLVIQHSVTHSHAEAGKQITEILEAIVSTGYPALLANPNDDAGGRVILAKMSEYAARYSSLHILPPPRSRERFASIMAHAGVLVGNSSSGIVEAMGVDLPVVNIGDRQRGREHLACWLNVDYDREQIEKAVTKALFDENYRSRLLAFSRKIRKRDTSTEVVNFLKNLDIRISSRPKQFLNLPFPESALIK